MVNLKHMASRKEVIYFLLNIEDYTFLNSQVSNKDMTIPSNSIALVTPVHLIMVFFQVMGS